MFQFNSVQCLTQSKHKMQFTSSSLKKRLQWSLSSYVKGVKVLIRAPSVLLTLHVDGTNNYVTGDPLLRAHLLSCRLIMSVKPGKIQFNLSDTQAERLRRLADLHGLPTASLASHIVNQWIFDNYEDHLKKFC